MTDKVFARPRMVDDGRGNARPAAIPREPGRDITRGPKGERSRHAIAPEGEWLRLTPYIRGLLLRGSLLRADPPVERPKRRTKPED